LLITNTATSYDATDNMADGDPAMTRALCTAVLAAALSLSLAAQQQKAPADAAKKAPAPPKVLTLSGCVEKGTMPNQFTLNDNNSGRYQVSGNDINKYVGRRVEVAGTPGPTRFRVKGGLWPTPNVAAQAGAIDPAKAAVASQPGGGANGTGDVDLPTLKVRSVRTLDGGCK
jgi:hypothetical protein